MIKLSEKSIERNKLLAKKMRMKQFHDFGGGVTVCLVTLNNGFKIVGKSICKDMTKFDSEIGKEIAYGDALAQLKACETYHLNALKNE